MSRDAERVESGAVASVVTTTGGKPASVIFYSPPIQSPSRFNFKKDPVGNCCVTLRTKNYTRARNEKQQRNIFIYHFNQQKCDGI